MKRCRSCVFMKAYGRQGSMACEKKLCENDLSANKCPHYKFFLGESRDEYTRGVK